MRKSGSYSHKYIILLFTLFTLFTGCQEDFNPRSKKDNFEVLWNTINERYCFFAYKNIDWNAVKAKYAPKVDSCQTSHDLFYVFADMLAELKDGHVNLYSTFDIARYWKWFEDYPRNFYPSVQEYYLKNNYQMAGGFKLQTLSDSVGYIYYGSFGSSVSNANISAAFEKFKGYKGIILDIRDNGGGSITNADLIAARFTKENRTVGYIKHKTGPGHNDFSEPRPISLTAYDGWRWEYPVVVLTNRHCYSAANYFVMIMRQLPNVTIIGDRTGGGSGLPFSSELPIGWSLRFSASPILNENKEDTEFGIDPDISVSFNSESIAKNIDPLIEAGKKHILEHP
ncbi:MAG: S41 family peptidase [Bacteroidales bacterium]